MQGFILDSTYKENIITDNNQNIFATSSNITLNKVSNSYNFPLNQTTSSYITHHQNSNNLNQYNIIDYL